MTKKIYFLLGEMTHLRYFVPLIRECDQRGIKSCLLTYQTNKYNCVNAHSAQLKQAINKYNTEIQSAHLFKKSNEIIFSIEKAAELANKKGIISLDIFLQNNHYVLTYQHDYAINYDVFSKYAKKVIFPSKWLLDDCESFINDHRTAPTKWSKEKVKSSKNVCIGSPKYDINLDKQDIIAKYKLSAKRKVLFLFPTPDPSSSYNFSRQSNGSLYKDNIEHGLTTDQIQSLYKTIKSLDFEVLTKSRAKHLIPSAFENDIDKCFYDDSWFPHTSMELMEVSDLVIMVDSTSVKECVLQKVPFINFDLKNEERYVTAIDAYKPLFDFEYCYNYKAFPELEHLKNTITKLTNQSFSQQFDLAIDQYLFQPGESSRKIVNFALDKL
tara:strand:- start:4258 stop:5403 length:1146 start_codon:yes stop_codon:yes gene_type:complete